MSGSDHVLDELSSYLDGECPDPDRVARHLQSCPACARRHLELLKISVELRALTAPEPSPAFTARVLTAVAAPPPKRAWFPTPTWQFATALAACGVTLLAAWSVLPGDSRTAPAPGPALNLAWQDDARVVEALAALLDAGAPMDLFQGEDPAAYPGEAEDPDLESVPVDSVLELLAEGVEAEPFMNAFEHDDLPELMDAAAGAPAGNGGAPSAESEV